MGGQQKPDNWMILVDLPNAFNIGRLPLRPLNAICHRLTRCDACQCHSAHSFTGGCGHSFCRGCATLPLTTITQEATQLWCNLCQKQQDTADADDDDTALDQMKFACACGAQGSLDQIKRHFWSEQGSHIPVRGGPDLSSAKGQTSVLVKPTQISDEGINASVERIKAVSADLNLLQSECERLVERVHGLQACDGDQGYGVFWIQAKNLIDKQRSSDSKEFTPIYKWYGNGLSFGTQFVVGNDDDDGELYFGATHRATFGRTSQFRPYRLILGTKLLDLKGKTVKIILTPTARNGRPISDSFGKVAPDFVNGGYGPSSLIKVSELMKPGANIVTTNGFVCIAMMVLASLDPEDGDIGSVESPRTETQRGNCAIS